VALLDAAAFRGSRAGPAAALRARAGGGHRGGAGAAARCRTDLPPPRDDHETDPRATGPRPRPDGAPGAGR
jgi:hypothetical protein